MTKITCPKCGAKNLEGETFCAKCGVRMASQAASVVSAAPVAVRAAPVAQPTITAAAAGKPKDMRKICLVIVAAVVVISVVAVFFFTRSNPQQPGQVPEQQTFVLTGNNISLESVFWYAPGEYLNDNGDWAGMRIRVTGKVYPDHPEFAPETIIYSYNCRYYINNQPIPSSDKYLIATESEYVNDEYLRDLIDYSSETVGVHEERVGPADSSKSNELQACCAVYEIQDLLKSSGSFYVRRMASNELCLIEMLASK